jgi:hypothetical protein
MLKTNKNKDMRLLDEISKQFEFITRKLLIKVRFLIQKRHLNGTFSSRMIGVFNPNILIWKYLSIAWIFG